MLDHLLTANPADYEDNFKPVSAIEPAELLDAQYATAKLLEDLGAPPDEQTISAAQSSAARSAFVAMTVPMSPQQQKNLLSRVQAPAAVRELVGMLTVYDWEFVEQAKELRGYTVAKITEETVHPDARIRLKALELLGKVTEVALFTERSEVKQVGMSDTELDAELKKRLDKYAALEKEIVGGEVIDNEGQ